MEVEVGRSQSARNVVRRVLNRCEVLGVIACRNNDHSAGVLTGRSLNSRTALCQSVLLGTVYRYTLDLKPFFNKAVSSLVGNSADCAGLKCMINSEKLLGVSVSIELIFTAEVKVNIGLFISLESKECFKRNIVTVTVHRNSAVRAILRRQVITRTDRTVHEKFRVLTFFTYIVRRQRVNLGNTCRMGNERRADRTSRADIIAVLLGVLNKLLCNHVKNAKSVGDN